MIQKVKQHRDRGDSLVEVLIAIMIMGLLGLTIVSSIIMLPSLSDKMNANGDAISALHAVAESVNQGNFVPCYSDAAAGIMPYPLSVGSVASPLQVSAIDSRQLPAVIIVQSSTGAANPTYNVQLSTGDASHTYTWSVVPALPAGMSLSSAGILSESTTTIPTEASKGYKFIATPTTSGSVLSKTMNLTIATASVSINNATGNANWPAVAPMAITKAIVNAAGNAISFYPTSMSNLFLGDAITFSGWTSNTALNLVNAKVAAINTDNFVVTTSDAGNVVNGAFTSGATYTASPSAVGTFSWINCSKLGNVSGISGSIAFGATVANFTCPTTCPFTASDYVTIYSGSNSALYYVSEVPTSISGSSLSVTGSAAAANYSGTGYRAAISAKANVQEITFSTTVGTQKFYRVIVKAA